MGKGDRRGSEGANYDFDVTLKKGGRVSVKFRGQSKSSVKRALGFSGSFYEKFDVLPFGETDKSKALYKVRMIDESSNGMEHFQVSNCKGGKCNKAYWIYCTPMLGMTDKFADGKCLWFNYDWREFLSFDHLDTWEWDKREKYAPKPLLHFEYVGHDPEQPFVTKMRPWHMGGARGMGMGKGPDENQTQLFLIVSTALRSMAASRWQGRVDSLNAREARHGNK